MKPGRRILMLIMILALLQSDINALAAANTLTLPAALQIIDEEAFCGDQSIDKVELGDNVEEIRARAFANSSLSEINLPDSLTFIDDTAFDGPERVIVTANEGTYAYQWAEQNGYIIEATPESDFTYYINDGECTIVKYNGSAEEVIVPRYLGGYIVTTISSSAFSQNKDLISVVLPNSIISIDSGAFYNCTSLKSYKGPLAWETGERVSPPFYGAYYLNIIEITGNLTEVPAYAFKRSSSVTSPYGSTYTYYGELQEIILPETVTSIAADAFANLTKMPQIDIPDSVTNIGVRAFSNCSSLTDFVFPSSLKTIDSYAFGGCSQLTDIIVPNGVTTIGEYAFYNCTGLKTYKGPLAWETGEKVSPPFYGAYYLNKIEITGNLAEVPAYAFKRSSSVTSPYGSTYTYYGELQEIILPETVTSIAADAFRNCSRLTGVMIPDSVSSIGDSAFASCGSSLTIYGKSGSYADTYATEKDIRFVGINGVYDYDTTTIENNPLIASVNVRSDTVVCGEHLEIEIVCNAATKVAEVYSNLLDDDDEEEYYFACHEYSIDSNGLHVFSFGIPYTSAGKYQLHFNALNNGVWSTFEETRVISVVTGLPRIIDVVMSESSIGLNDLVVFTAWTVNAEQIKMVVDDTWEFVYPIIADCTTFEHYFSKGGERSIQFAVCDGAGNWSELTVPTILDVAIESISEAVTNEGLISYCKPMPESVLSGHAFMISIGTRNAEKVRLYVDGNMYTCDLYDEEETVKYADGYPVGSNGSVSIDILFDTLGEKTLTLKPVVCGEELDKGITFKTKVVSAHHIHIWEDAELVNGSWQQRCSVHGCDGVKILSASQLNETTCRHQWSKSGWSDYVCSYCGMTAPKLNSESYRNILHNLDTGHNPMEDLDLRAFISCDLQKNGLSIARSWRMIDTLIKADGTYRDLYLYTYDLYDKDFRLGSKPSHFIHSWTEKKLYIYKDLADGEFLSEFFHETGHAIDFVTGSSGELSCDTSSNIRNNVYYNLSIDGHAYINKILSIIDKAGSSNETDQTAVKAAIMSGKYTLVTYQEGYDSPKFYHKSGDHWAYPIMYDNSIIPAAQSLLYYNTIESAIEYLNDEHDSAIQYYSWYPTNSIMVFDAIGGITNNTICVAGEGHGPTISSKNTYWYSGNGTPTYAQNREAFACFYSAKILGDSYANTLNGTYFYNTCRYLEENLVKQMTKNLCK